MNYYRIGGQVPIFATGLQIPDVNSLQEGFDRFECESLDATEFIPCGGMTRVEWDSQSRPVRNWYEAQIIAIRGY